MRKIFLVVFIGSMLCSCTEFDHIDIDDDVVELNWNYAVKDFYLLECEDERILQENVVVRF